MIDQYPLSFLLSLRTYTVRKYASPFAPPRPRDHEHPLINVHYPLSILLSLRTYTVRKYASPFAPRPRDGSQGERDHSLKIDLDWDLVNSKYALK
jgi:hypothetical protein